MLRRFVAGYFGGGWLPELLFLGYHISMLFRIVSASAAELKSVLPSGLMLLAGILLAGLWNLARGRIASGMKHLAALLPCFFFFAVLVAFAGKERQIQTKYSVVDSQYSADTPERIPPRPAQATQIYVDGRGHNYDFQYHVAEQDLRNWLTQAGWTVVEVSEKQGRSGIISLEAKVPVVGIPGRVTDLATKEERQLESWILAQILFDKKSPSHGGIQITYDPITEIAYGQYWGW